MRVLITGGAGFIGSHLADDLLDAGHDVRVLDSLLPQVHPGGMKPDYLSSDVEFMRGDVRDGNALRLALKGADAVVHLAARVGVGQSMYEIDEYVSTNSGGTATLLQCLIEQPVKRLVLASSMSIYGEGLYETETGATVSDARRSTEQIRRGAWDPLDDDGCPLHPCPTPESKQPDLASVYALSKFDQERASLLVGAAYDIPTVALRFFNVYGPRQALSNPYTGVLAIFASRLLNSRAPLIFEDGRQLRDFVSVHDVTRACVLALERPAPDVAGRAFNIGSGEAYRIVDIACMLADALGRKTTPQITRRFRIGDVRHCFADISDARARLGYEPAVALRKGLDELTGWLANQQADDNVLQASAELEQRGLTV